MKLSDTLWAVGLSGIGRGLETPALPASDGKASPNKSTFTRMTDTPGGGVILSTRDHDIGDRITESRSR